DRARREADARSATEAELRAQAETQRDQAAAAREDAQDTLTRSLLDQARALRLSRQPGRRWQALEFLRRAELLRARVRQTVSPPGAASVPSRNDLRREAAAALLLEDARELSTIQVPLFLNVNGIVSEDGRRGIYLFTREGVGAARPLPRVWFTDLE